MCTACYNAGVASGVDNAASSCVRDARDCLKLCANEAESEVLVDCACADEDVEGADDSHIPGITFAPPEDDSGIFTRTPVAPLGNLTVDAHFSLLTTVRLPASRTKTSCPAHTRRPPRSRTRVRMRASAYGD